MAEPEKFVEWVTGQPMALVEATNSVFRTSSSQSVGLVPIPPNPPVGSFLRDDGTWASVSVAGFSYRPPTERLFTTAGEQEYSYPAGVVALWVRVGGAGGGGGGAILTTAGQAPNVGAGGAGGGLGERLFTVASISTTVTIVVGTAGVGVSGTIGTSGADSAFGIYITASGGSAGGVSSIVPPTSPDLSFGQNIIIGGAGGSAAGGLNNVKGQPGFNAQRTKNSPGGVVVQNFYPAGGGSFPGFGAGGKQITIGATNAVQGNDAFGLGSGGGGGVVLSNTNSVRGGNGTNGFIYIMEIYQLST